MYFRVSLAKHNFVSAEGTTLLVSSTNSVINLCCSTKKKSWTWNYLLIVCFWIAWFSLAGWKLLSFHMWIWILPNFPLHQHSTPIWPCWRIVLNIKFSVIYSANQQGDRHVALYIFEMVPCVIPRIRLGALVFLSFFTHLVKHRSYLHMTNHRTGEIQHSDLSRYLELISPFRWVGLNPLQISQAILRGLITWDKYFSSFNLIINLYLIQGLSALKTSPRAPQAPFLVPSLINIYTTHECCQTGSRTQLNT